MGSVWEQQWLPLQTGFLSGQPMEADGAGEVRRGAGVSCLLGEACLLCAKYSFSGQRVLFKVFLQ